MGAAAAIIIRKEKEIVRAFKGVGATIASKAVSTSDVGVEERVPFGLLRRRNVIREAAPGRYYLDEAAWERMGQRRRMVLGVVGALILAAVALAYYMTSRPG